MHVPPKPQAAGACRAVLREPIRIIGVRLIRVESDEEIRIISVPPNERERARREARVLDFACDGLHAPLSALAARRVKGEIVYCRAAWLPFIRVGYTTQACISRPVSLQPAWRAT